MRSVTIRGGLVAAAIAIIVFNHGFAPPLLAQQSSVQSDFAAQGEWNSATTYQVDDLVTSRGSTWRAKVVNTNRIPGSTAPDTSGFWELFARGFNPTGAWSNATRYQPDDLVTSGGQTYRAKVTSLNRQPTNTNFWEVLAAKGDQGPAGPNTGVSTGSQSTPAISFSGDVDTGLYSPSAGKIAIVEDGALFLHNIGTSNTALGVQTLQANTTGNGNTGMGHATLLSNTTGAGNTAIGGFALRTNTTGGNNTAVGLDALFNNTTGGVNAAVGLSALNTNTTGNFNTAIGGSALHSNSTGSGNTAVGRLALGSNTVASSNTAVGDRALQSNTTGSINTAVGIQALSSNTAGSGNSALGRFALAANTTGDDNIAIGDAAGANPTAPSASIFIGNSGAAVDTHTIKIGATQTSAFIAGIRGVTTGQNNAVSVVIDSAGQLGTVSSSRRYKFDIETMEDVPAMLAKLRPVTFRYKQAQSDGAHPLQYGLIAEEVAGVFPDLAVFNKDGQPETVKYHLLPNFLLAGYQAQQKTIAAQEEKIEAQQHEIDALRQEVRAIAASLGQAPARAAALQ